STTKTEFKETQEKDPKDPGDSITFNLGYSFTSNLKLAWQTINMSDESAPDGDYNDKEGYRVHDIAINYKPSSIKGLTLVGGIDNITDEEYISHISENRTLTYQRGNPDTANSADFEPGRNIKVSVSYKF
ncbi:MAG: TonB-dependent receptor, partial [Campylobacterales bacterium]|nr:TonB-dependent receptor [Campylobacterales bacterium]